MIVVIGVVFTPLIARTVRATVLSERELDYVQAAKLRGEGGLYIMFVEILPNVMAPILVEFTVRLGYAIFAVASLSFIGYGLQPPSPDWAVQVFEHYSVVSFALVDRALPVPRDRLARGRGEPDRGRDRAGLES